NRFKVSNATLEAAFAGDSSADTWGELLPGIDETAAGGRADGDCAALPVKRVVRLDSSGTSFVLKDWLDTINAARGWPGFANTAWPNDSGNTMVIRGAANGGGPVGDALNANDGSIGYMDLATSRSKGFDWTPNTGDTTFWIPTRNGANSLQEPTLDP